MIIVYEHENLKETGERERENREKECGGGGESPMTDRFEAVNVEEFV